MHDLMSIEERINQLTEFFHDQFKEIRRLNLPEPNNGQIDIYQKTLLIAVIDCLASIRFDKSNYPYLFNQNRIRFTRFVKEYGNWPCGNRVSTPFLVSRLEGKGLNGPLHDKVRAHLDKFDPTAGFSVSIEKMDFLPEELRPLSTLESEEKIIEDVQHLSLLYRYRNHLVHEYRTPGYGMEVFAKGLNTACYHGYLNDKHFYLVYPTVLFENIVMAAIDGIEKYLIDNRVDPYNRVGDTSRW